MDKRAFAAEVTRVLCLGKRVTCSLGAIESCIYAGYAGRNPRTGEVVPVPDKRLPRFRPTDEFLAKACGSLRVPASSYFRGHPPPGAVHVYAVDAREDEVEDGDVPDTAAPKWTATESVALDVGGLADEIAAALRAGKRFPISGFGTFGARRLKRRLVDLDADTIVADADLCGKVTVYVVFSPVLKDELQRAINAL